MRLLLFLLFPFVFSSCSLLGSRVSTHQMPTQKIKNVAVIVTQPDVIPGQSSEGEHLLLTKTLAEELSVRNIFRYKILDRQVSSYAFDNLETSLTGFELSAQYDAFLIASPVRRTNGYRVELKLVQTAPAGLLISARHSNAFGNSYWLYQSSAGLLVDATRGAVDAFASRLVKVQKNVP